MNRLPRVSGREWFGALSKVGFYIRRQQGSDIIMRRDDPFGQVVVPDQRELDTGTLRAIVRQAGLGVEGFSHLL
jgi:predicted RNA binding protein YcfA (HicA-like mRNA interferase family)